MQTMFVITGLTHTQPQEAPNFETAHNAALQAIRTAVHMSPDLGANMIYLGGEPRGYIQGNQRPRADNFTSLANMLIGSAYRAITRQKDEYQTDLVYLNGNVEHKHTPHPAVIQHSWNNTDRLVELAPAPDPHYQPEPGIYPHALLTHDGLLLQPEPVPETDVFGDPITCTMHEFEECPDTSDTEGIEAGCPHTVNRYFKTHGRNSFTIMPMAEMACVQYRAEYVRTLARYPSKIAIQLSWE